MLDKNNRLLDISKPGRYVGSEINSIKKDNHNELTSFCLIFPDIYEIGSSHLGYRLLYDILNRSDKISCERFFAPWVDAVEMFGSDIFRSIEHSKSLKDFDVLGFSIAYELSYTTILAILKNSDISLRSKDRLDDNSTPIIIAGGGATFNPAPISTFMDIFYIGEADDHITKIVEEIGDLKSQSKSKKDILIYLNDKYTFLYIPLIDPDKRPLRDVSKTFAESKGVQKPLITMLEAVQDRITVEIARGCTAGCRFCQAGMIYRPVRERSVENITNEAMNQAANSGYKEVSLLSLSTGDYSQITPLIENLHRGLDSKHTSLSTPSLRADSVSKELFKEITGVRRSSFTIAPEAGSERMRKVINKNLSEEQILDSIKLASECGVTSVKLYFMIGLPFETDDDIKDIIELARKIYHAANKRSFNVTISISNFVPKAHTIFEFLGQNTADEFHRKMQLLKKEIAPTRFKLKYHDIKTSKIEAVLSRGDKSIGNLLEKIVEKGGYLDPWHEFFNYDMWTDTASEIGVDMLNIAEKNYDANDVLPWDNIDTGVTKKFKLKEFEAAKNEAMIDDCRRGKCFACGVCDFKVIQVTNAKPIDEKFLIDNGLGTKSESDIANNNDKKDEKNYFNYLIRYKKDKAAKFLSTLDTVRLINHTLDICKVNLAYTEGFNPQPRIVLIQPLQVGVSGDNEILLIRAEIENFDTFIEEVNKSMVDGIELKNIEKIQSLKLNSSLKIKLELTSSNYDLFIKLLNGGTNFYEVEDKKGRLKKVFIDEYLISHADNILEMKVTSQGAFNMLKFFRSAGLKSSEIEINRLGIEEFNDELTDELVGELINE